MLQTSFNQIMITRLSGGSMLKVTLKTILRSVDTKQYVKSNSTFTTSSEHLHTDEAGCFPIGPNPGNTPKLLLVVWYHGTLPN